MIANRKAALPCRLFRAFIVGEQIQRGGIGMIIDVEFKNLIPRLTAEEYEQLEKNIIAEGCRDALVTWQDILIDGHNRYEICKKRGIDFKTVEKEFDSRQDATEWIILNQFGRRNLSAYDRSLLALKLKPIVAEKAKENILATQNNAQSAAFQKSDKQIHTDKEIAQIAGVSHDTINKVEKIESKAAPEVKEKLKSGNISINTASLIATKPQREQKEIVARGEKEILEAAKAIKQEKREERIKERQKVVEELKNTIKEMPTNITLLEGDIFGQITNVPDGSIDCLITDPPYLVMDDYEWDKQDIQFLRNWIEIIKPKFKPEFTGFIFCDARMQFEFEQVIREHFSIKNRIIWIRKNMSMGRVIKDKFISSYEVVFYFGTKELNLPEEWGAERFDSFECAVPQSNFKEGKYHPTQKPLALIEHLVKVGSFPGDKILDCFAGSGTTGIAVKNVGNRDCVLIEREPEYCQIIKGRVSDG